MHLTYYGAIAILTALARCSLADNAIPRGVSPQDAEKYVPNEQGKWACLGNPEIILDWNQVNDDFCDCPDGSDEPGSSACPNGKFWCNNEGHRGQFIDSSLVGDGVCDYDVCCDGSDEYGVKECKNMCQEIHDQEEAERKQNAAERKIAIDKTEKILRAAKRLRGKLEEELKVSEALLGFHERELERFRKIAQEKQEKTFGTELTALKQKSDETRAKIYDHFNAMTLGNKNLQTVKSILDELLETFNENLNDAAVKKTVEDFENHLKIHKRSYTNAFDFDKVQREVFDKFSGTVQDVTESHDWINSQIKTAIDKFSGVNSKLGELESYLQYLSENYNPNFNDPNVKKAVSAYQDYISNKESITIKEDILETIADSLSSVKDAVIKIKEKATVKKTDEKDIKAPVGSTSGKSIIETLKSKAHFMINDFLGIAPPKRIKMPEPENEEENDKVIAEFETERAKEEKAINSIKDSLAKNFGPGDLFRPMEGVTAKAKIGEYDYELEFINEVRQKGNGNNALIGVFDRVEQVEDENEEAVIAYYENGAKCWNGPKRRAVIKMTCGAEHELLGVSEPEKCEYHFRMKSPLGCRI